MNTADTAQLPDDLYEVTEAPFEADEEGPYLFISYAHKSRKDVFASIRRIYEQGWRIWYDEGLTISSVRIHENTRVICEYAFRNCGNLTELHIPDSVRFIGEQAFERCAKLDTVHISAGLRALGISAFYGCSRLREAILPDSLRVIENGVFAECGALEYVRLPERPERVSDSAFKGSPKVRFRKKKWLLF